MRPVLRFRGSHHFAAHSHASFGNMRSTGNLIIPVPLNLKFLRWTRRVSGRNFGINVLALTIAAALASLAVTEAAADGCARSRDHLLGGLAGDLPQGPQSYKHLFKVCIATANLANVRNAFILKDGGIGVVAKNDSIGATAATLSDFCRRFPRATLRFVSKKDFSRVKTIARTVELSSGRSTSCRKIMGLAAN